MSASPSQTRPPEAPPAPKRRRDPWFDNIKMTLVTFVVMGHSWTLVPKHLPRAWVYDFVYTWHMPAFVLITGYMSRSFTWTPRRLWQLVTTLLVPYVIFERLLTLYRHELLGINFHRLWLNPHWPLWYLVAVIVWRLVTPAMLRLPPPARLALAVAVSLAGGFYPGETLDLSRLSGFFPFFVIGLTLRGEVWEWLRSERGRRVGIGVLVVLFGFAAVMEHLVPAGWLYYDTPYADLEPNVAKALLLRVVVLALGTVGALAVCSVVPRGQSLWTRMGANSLVVYLYHGFFIVTAGALGVRGFTSGHQLLGLLGCSLVAIAVASFLAYPPVARVLGVLVDPVGRVTEWRARRRRRPDPTSA